ncbi:MAG: putative membrane protein [Halioglobus sp.]
MALNSQDTTPYSIHRVPLTRPLIWLEKGWDDMMHHRGASLAYGWLVSAFGALVLAYERHPFFIAFTITAFLLVGPIMTAGLCELSRRQSIGEKADFGTSLSALRGHRHNLMSFANALFVVGLLWFIVSSAIAYGATGSIAPTLQSTVGGDVLRQVSTTQLISYVASGGVLACIVFAVSVVAVPMIIENNLDAKTAMRTSLRVTLRDLPAMLVWGALIAALVAIGFATYLVGMIVIFPLLGHATWHAYKDLVH